MHCDEAQELITARVDNELDAEARVAIDAHLKSCPECTRTFEQESILKRRIHLTAQQISAPVGLRRAVEEKATAQAAAAAGSTWYSAAWAAIQLNVAGSRWRKITDQISFPSRRAAVAAEPRWRKILNEATLPIWRRAFAVAVVLLIVGSVIYTQRGAEKSENIALAALDTHLSIVSGKTELLRAVNLAAMRNELAHAVGDRFKPVVLDLSLMKLYPVAGFVQNIGGRDLLVTVYQGDGPAVTCFTFLGSETDAPQGAERFYDADMKINFYSFTRDELNGVLHQEGEVICLLVSTMAPADLLALLRGKTAHA